MNDVLEQYETPYDPDQPRINFDEKLYQLTIRTREKISCTPNKVERIDYEYERFGTVNHFVGIEMKTGRHFVRVTDRRTKNDLAQFIGYLCLTVYPKAKLIHLIADNLNTHTDKAIIDYYGKRKGQQIVNRIKWHYTPEHASWLNAAEIEIGVLESKVLRNKIKSSSKLFKKINLLKSQKRTRSKRQGLTHAQYHIQAQYLIKQELKQQVQAFVRNRNKIKATINWQFTKKKANDWIQKKLS